MKPSREEVLRVSQECGIDVLIGQRDDGSSCEFYEGWPEQFERFAAAMYEAGVAAERAVSDRLLGALKDAK